MAIKRKDFQKLSSTVQEFLLKLPDEETSSRLRDNLLHALHYLQQYYRVLQNRDRTTSDSVQWTIDHSLSPLTPFREAPDKFEWDWISVDSQKVRQSLSKATSIENVKQLPSVIAAIRDGDFNTVKDIVKQDTNSVNSTDLFMRDCITYAIQYDQLEILKFLIQNGAKINNIASDSSTNLHRAVYKGNSQAVELLLSHKANVNAQDCYNRAPLHWSVINENVECLKILLKFNANVHIKDKDGMSPTMWACSLDHLEHFKLLTSITDEREIDNDGRTWVHWSVRKTEPLKCLKVLINAETALLKDKDGKTCLHVAAEQGAVHACKLIIENADARVINDRDNKKQTPLHLATLNGHARAIKILMDNGADALIKDMTGASPIDYVTKRNLFFCNSIIEICLRKGEPKNRGGASSSNSVSSSFNGSELNLTPAPPTTPKNAYSRSFQQLSLSLSSSKEVNGRPPRPSMAHTVGGGSLNASDSFNGSQSLDLVKTAPANLGAGTGANADEPEIRHSIPPSPPTVAKTSRPPMYRAGWSSLERIASGSLRLSRASTRTSLASDDLEKYMNGSGGGGGNGAPAALGGVGGSLNNVNTHNEELMAPALSKPLPPPRVSSSGSAGTSRVLSAGGGGGGARNQEFGAISADAQPQIHSANSSVPPPVKPRKSSSISSLNPTSNTEPQTSNWFNNNHNLSENHLNKIVSTTNRKVTQQNSIDVEDVSGDELSITSVKGEGCGSDLSDSEAAGANRPPATLYGAAAAQKSNRSAKKALMFGQAEPSLKRPTTPMDFRAVPPTTTGQTTKLSATSRPAADSAATKNVRFQQPFSHEISNGRFNEWDPFAANRLQQQQNERQKSPLKSKQAQQQQQQQQQQSAFAHSFLTQDSSPRQTSGRLNAVSSATQKFQTMTTFQQQYHQQQQQQQQQSQFVLVNPLGGGGIPDGNNNNNNLNSSASNLDLIISGQKLGPRRESPTNTPRDSSAYRQANESSARVFTRRLQPIEKSGAENANNALNSSGEGQIFRQKTSSKSTSDRKKLEPLRNTASNNNPTSATSQAESTTTGGGHSLSENEPTTVTFGGGGHTNATSTAGGNDDEPSISENTISSDKQVQPASQFIKMKKSGYGKNRKKFIEPILGSDEALKM